MMQIFRNACVLLPGGLRSDREVLVDGRRIVAVRPRNAAIEGATEIDCEGDILAPGFIDVQVNGGGGTLFNDAPTIASIEAIGRAHRTFGTTGFMPTLMSDDLDVVRAGVAAVDAAIAQGVPGVLGIHIEGPFLNSRRKGIHDASKLRALDEEGFAAITALRRGRTLVTLAPERTNLTMIRRLVECGVIVAGGHTDATYRQMRDALDAGLSGFTHLFNAMSPLTARDPGAVGAALDDVHSWCGLIVDGRHIDPVTMRIALRCKTPDLFMLVTDAMPSVGMIDKRFMLQGQPIEVVDGVCVNGDGVLAGSDLDMASAVRNAVRLLSLPAAQALNMASLNPAQFLGLGGGAGSIVAGAPADLVRLDSDFCVRGTWIGGAEMP
jgi:N-acetylglucosamine-6-phosphate deacetylase